MVLPKSFWGFYFSKPSRAKKTQIMIVNESKLNGSSGLWGSWDFVKSEIVMMFEFERSKW